MAGITIPRTLKNFNLKVEGVGYAGKATEVQLPNIAIKTEDHMAGGQEFARKIDMGLEDIEVSITCAEYSAALRKLVGIFNASETSVTIYGAIHDDISPSAQNVTIEIRGTFTKVEPSAFGAGKKTEDKYSVACKFYKETVDGVDVYEIDNDNYKRVIGGVDQVESIRSAIRM